MDYGRFNSAEELLKGYTELEKSFTQKCQQLSALERSIALASKGTEQTEAVADVQNEQTSAIAIETSGTSEGQPSSPPTETRASTEDGATVPDVAQADDNATSAPSAPPTVMTGGGNVSVAPPNRPKTLKEASELAKKYFK